MTSNSTMNGTESELDTTQFINTPVIKRLKRAPSKEAPKEAPSEATNETPDEPKSKSTRGRKRKYSSPEERLAARRLQQKAYRERKKAELIALRARSEGSNEASPSTPQADSE